MCKKDISRFLQTTELEHTTYPDVSRDDKTNEMQKYLFSFLLMHLNSLLCFILMETSVSIAS